MIFNFSSIIHAHTHVKHVRARVYFLIHILKYFTIFAWSKLSDLNMINSLVVSYTDGSALTCEMSERNTHPYFTL